MMTTNAIHEMPASGKIGPTLVAGFVSAVLVVGWCASLWWIVEIRSAPPPPPNHGYQQSSR